MKKTLILILDICIRAAFLLYATHILTSSRLFDSQSLIATSMMAFNLVTMFFDVNYKKDVKAANTK